MGETAFENFLSKKRIARSLPSFSTLYQERAVFGKMEMDPAKRAQTQNTGEVSSLQWSLFPIR
jgi:hypothetical protein